MLDARINKLLLYSEAIHVHCLLRLTPPTVCHHLALTVQDDRCRQEKKLPATFEICKQGIAHEFSMFSFSPFSRCINSFFLLLKRERKQSYFEWSMLHSCKKNCLSKHRPTDEHMVHVFSQVFGPIQLVHSSLYLSLKIFMNFINT